MTPSNKALLPALAVAWLAWIGPEHCLKPVDVTALYEQTYHQLVSAPETRILVDKATTLYDRVVETWRLLAR